MPIDTPYASVWRAADTDQQTVVDVLTKAFMDDPVVCWLFPDVGDRGRLQAHFHRPLLIHPAGETYLVGRHEGAAVWLRMAAGQAPYGEPETEPNPAFGASGARLLALGQAVAERHPVHEPHLYLPCMGVVRQGAGLGSAMLRDRLTRADTDGLAAYLEASSPRSRALYLRHGFEDLGEPIHTGDSPLLWPMWRPTNTQGEQR